MSRRGTRNRSRAIGCREGDIARLHGARPAICLSISFTRGRAPASAMRHYTSSTAAIQRDRRRRVIRHALVHGDRRARAAVGRAAAGAAVTAAEIDAGRAQCGAVGGGSVFILPPPDALGGMRKRGQDSAGPRAPAAAPRGDVALRRVRLRHRQRGIRDRGRRDVRDLRRQPPARAPAERQPDWRAR